MMKRWLLVFAVLVCAFATGERSASAQYHYPGGYGGWGWGGWGGESVQGSIARGLGAFAQGAGVYNQETAVANSINADTAMRWNQYLWQSQQEANKRYHDRLARQSTSRNQAREDILRRLRDQPEAADIARGDALNVAFDEVTNPNVYARTLAASKAKVPGTLIRDIPFQYASAAITTSVDELTKGGPPEALRGKEFEADRATLRELASQIREHHEQHGKIDPTMLAKVRDVIHEMRVKVEATVPAGTRQRNDAEKFLKGLFGLSRMLETPAVDVLLSGLDNRPDTDLGDLLSFMTAFNLRFGLASTPRQREVYTQLYPLLRNLRNEVGKGGDATQTAVATAPADAPHPTEFFSGMPMEQLDAPSRPLAPVPTRPIPPAPPAKP